MEPGLPCYDRIVFQGAFQHWFGSHGAERALGQSCVICHHRLLIGDEQAVKNCWASNGASGFLPCFFCKNATLHSLSLWQTDSTNYLQSHCQLDTSKLDFQSDNSSRSAVQYLKNQHGHISKEAFGRIEKSLGLNYAPAGALQSDTFWGLLDGGPICVIQYDFMRALLSGAWNTETGLLFQALKDHISCKAADDFVSKFVWPIQWEGRSATGKRCVEKHTADGGEVKASASEGLQCLSSYQAAADGN